MQKGVRTKAGIWNRRWHFFCRFLTGTSGDRNFSQRKKMIVAGSLLAIAVVLLVTPRAYALDPSSVFSAIANWIIAIGTSLLITLMELLGLILIFLVDLLIKIVQYNNFVRAFPVTVGWPLMRDTVNMFFIIVILVSAFATIIGYPKEFHYKQVLPKLLLMAVLINFSKTLIGLMIDFSQVVLLTFVNGFKQAAGGNFVQALRIGDVMRIGSSLGEQVVDDSGGEIVVKWSQAQNVDSYTMMHIFGAAVFGTWILSISITLILIMIIFFLARVIMLWFLLITSPVMFFAWALPGKLQKGFSAFTDQWWQRLSTALIGGPVLAFFLWLSLAMAQKQGEFIGAQGLYQETKTSELEAAKSSRAGSGITSTKIGSPEVFAQFIIMVAFMLMGVQVAVSSSKAVGGPVGQLAGKIAGFGGSFGAGAAGAVLAARIGGRAVEKGAKTADRVLDIRGGVARQVLKTKAAQQLLPTGALAGLGRVAGERQKRVAKKAEETKQAFATLSPTERFKALQNLESSRFTGGTTRDAIVGMKAKEVMGGAFKKDASAKMLAEVKQDAAFANLSEEEQKMEAGRRVNQTIATALDSAEKYATQKGDSDLLSSINDEREKNASLISDIKSRQKMVGNLASDRAGLAKMRDDSFADAATTWAALKSNNWLNEAGELTVDQSDKTFKDFMRGRRGNFVRAHMDARERDPKVKESVATLLNGDATEEQLRSANYTVSISNNGKESRVIQGGVGASRTITQPTGRTFNRNEAQSGITDNGVKTRLNRELRSAGVNPDNLGVRMDNRLANEVIGAVKTINQAEGSAKPDAQARATAQLAKHDVHFSSTVGFDRESGAYQDGSAERLHTQAIKNIAQAGDGAAFANSLKQAVEARKQSKDRRVDALASHARAMEGEGLDQVEKMIEQATGAQKSELQKGLREIAQLGQSLGSQTRALSANEQAIADLEKQLRTKPRIQRLIAEGHSPSAPTTSPEIPELEIAPPATPPPPPIQPPPPAPPPTGE